MSSDAFKAKAYIKEGCPFSFKYLIFMTEAGLLDRIDVIRLNESDADFEATKSRLTKALGKPATFPTVEVEPGRFMSDSDRLIDYYSAQSGTKPEDTTLLSFYKETILPELLELHETAEKLLR